MKIAMGQYTWCCHSFVGSRFVFHIFLHGCKVVMCVAAVTFDSCIRLRACQ